MVHALEQAEKASANEPAPYALDNFKLSEATKTNLRSRGIEALFEIQAKTFDLICKGNDVIGRARTGCGKTLAFALPIVEKLHAVRAAACCLPPPRLRLTPL